MNTIINKKRSNVFTFLICIMPLLHHYASPIPNITLGEFGLVILTVIGLIEYILLGKKISISPYLVFIYILLLTSLLSALTQFPNFDFDAVIKLFARLIFYFILIVIVGKIYFNFPLAVKIYRNISIIACLFLFTQIVSFYSFNHIIPSVISWIPLYNNATYELIDFNAVYTHLFRPQSFFLEPGVFAQYIFPALMLSLFKINKAVDNVNIKQALFFSISLIATLSAQAIIITIFVWFYWLLFINKKFSLYKKIGLILSGIFCAFVFIVLIFNVEPLHKATIGRFVEGTTYDSTGVRVVRGFQVFQELSPGYKMIGTGYGNVTTFVSENEIRTENDLYAISVDGNRQYNYEYMNSIAYVLVTGGLVSFLSFIILFLDLFKKTIGFSRICVVLLLLISLYGGTLISTTWIIFMMFIYEGARFYNLKKSDLINEIN